MCPLWQQMVPRHRFPAAAVHYIHSTGASILILISSHADTNVQPQATVPQERLQQQRLWDTSVPSTGQQLHQKMLPSKNSGRGTLQPIVRCAALRPRKNGCCSHRSCHIYSRMYLCNGRRSTRSKCRSNYNMHHSRFNRRQLRWMRPDYHAGKRECQGCTSTSRIALCSGSAAIKQTQTTAIAEQQPTIIQPKQSQL